MSYKVSIIIVWIIFTVNCNEKSRKKFNIGGTTWSNQLNRVEYKKDLIKFKEK